MTKKPVRNAESRVQNAECPFVLRTQGPKGGVRSEEKAAAKCCAPDASQNNSAGTAQEAFEEFMGKAFAPGALDAAQKEIMTIALSVAVQCEPCLKIHLEKARGMGITPDEIREAAWMGIVFGGCKAMMFWKEKGEGRV